MYIKLAWFMGTIVLLVPLFTSTKVIAANETYSWINEQTIMVNGGETPSAGVKLTKATSITWEAVDGFIHGSCRIRIFYVQIMDGDGSQGVIGAQRENLGTQGDLCSQSIVDTYHGRTISIRNVQNRQNNAPETADQKKVTVNSSIQTDLDTNNTEEYEQYSGQVPQTDEITLNSNIGVKIATKESAKVATAGGGFSYVTSFDNIPVGDYEVCSKVAENCAVFKKEFGVTKSVTIDAKNAPLTIVKASADSVTCESGQGALGWILCPVAERLLNSLRDLATGEINKLLFTDLKEPNDTNPIYKTWKGFQTVANVLLVPVFMYVIIRAASGGGGRE